MKKYDPVELFTPKTKKLIVDADASASNSIDDIIKAQEASDKSKKIKSILNSWSIQQAQERKLRKIYAICFVVFMSIQMLAMITFFLLIGFQIMSLSDVQFSAFFISLFGEITALVTIVTKYLFPQGNETKVLDILKDL